MERFISTVRIAFTPVDGWAHNKSKRKTMETLPSAIIDILRSLMPTATLYMLARPLTEAEARVIAERQATKLLELLSITRPSVEIERVMELPGITIEVLADLPWSGYSDWRDDHWHIQINANDSLWRCRASLAHELKHILDDPYREELYPDWPHGSTTAPPKQAENISEYFAGCVLAPTDWLKKAWNHGMHDAAKLASLFDVSEALIRVRLSQIGLSAGNLRSYSRRAYTRSTALVQCAAKRLHDRAQQPHVGVQSCV
jgi:Zn-dependent peptidase ImmA (M78 family)